MALADLTAVSAIQSLTQGSTMTIKPTSPAEWIIHNLEWEIPTGGTIEVRKTDGTLVAKYDSDQSSGGRFNLTLHVTSAIWFEIKNISATAITVIASYDGIISK